MRSLLPLVLLLAPLGCEKIIGVDELQIVRKLDAGPEPASDAGSDAAAPSCVGDSTPCGQCIQQSCCPAALGCSTDPTCAACLSTSAPPAPCDSDKKLEAYAACARASCAKECGL